MALSENRCDGTAALREAVQAIAPKVPIVMALGSYTSDEVLTVLQAGEVGGMEQEEMVLGDYEPMETSGKSHSAGWLFAICDDVGMKPPGPGPL